MWIFPSWMAAGADQGHTARSFNLLWCSHLGAQFPRCWLTMGSWSWSFIRSSTHGFDPKDAGADASRCHDMFSAINRLGRPWEFDLTKRLRTSGLDPGVPGGSISPWSTKPWRKSHPHTRCDRENFESPNFPGDAQDLFGNAVAPPSLHCPLWHFNGKHPSNKGPVGGAWWRVVSSCRSLLKPLGDSSEWVVSMAMPAALVAQMAEQFNGKPCFTTSVPEWSIFLFILNPGQKKYLHCLIQRLGFRRMFDKQSFCGFTVEQQI